MTPFESDVVCLGFTMAALEEENNSTIYHIEILIFVYITMSYFHRLLSTVNFILQRLSRWLAQCYLKVFGDNFLFVC